MRTQDSDLTESWVRINARDAEVLHTLSAPTPVRHVVGIMLIDLLLRGLARIRKSSSTLTRLLCFLVPVGGFHGSVSIKFRWWSSSWRLQQRCVVGAHEEITQLALGLLIVAQYLWLLHLLPPAPLRHEASHSAPSQRTASWLVVGLMGLPAVCRWPMSSACGSTYDFDSACA